MSQKTLKPTLTGQRIRTRKRDEKHRKLDPETFRDEILIGLEEAGDNFDEILVFLEQAGHRLEYNRYSETLFNVLFAGNLIAPGGQIEDENRWEGCVFNCTDDKDLHSFHEVLEKLMRRYKYLLKAFQNHITHLIKFINIWPENYVLNFAKILGFIFTTSSILSLKCLESLFADHLIRNDVTLNFVTDIFKYWLSNTDFETFSITLKKSGLDNRLGEFFPESKRKNDQIEAHFSEAGLEELVRFLKQKATATATAELKIKLESMFSEGEATSAQIGETVFAASKEAGIPETQLMAIVWPCVMDSVEWNKKSDMLEKQVVSHMSTHASLLSQFTKTGRAQLNSLNVMQKYCYENMGFLKYLRPIVLALYNNDVLEEEAIIKWYKDSHISKGWSVFQDQMQPLITWLESAESDSE